MDFNKLYAELAAKLGDLEYKLYVLQKQRESLLKSIEQLDQAAGLAAKANETQKPQT